MIDRAQALVDSFLNPGAPRRTLADLILEKIAEKERGADAMEEDDDALPPKVVEAYGGMVPLLQRRSPGVRLWWCRRGGGGVRSRPRRNRGVRLRRRRGARPFAAA